jgi:hypothetical protein
MYVCMYVCMYIRTYVCMYVCMYACMSVCLHVCLQIFMYVCLYACMYVRLHACMHVCIHACLYICMHVSMYACMYLCMHACMYVYKWKRNLFNLKAAINHSDLSGLSRYKGSGSARLTFRRAASLRSGIECGHRVCGWSRAHRFCPRALRPLRVCAVCGSVM